MTLFRMAAICLGLAASACAQTLLVPAGSVWKYLDDGSDPGIGWRATNFNDSAWLAGPAELGYGDTSDGRPEATVLGWGPNANAKYITSYFRRAFQVAQPSAYTNLLLGLMRDDGAVVYLNGIEVFRSNMTNAPITYTTPALLAVGGSDEFTFYTTNLSPALLLPGTNLLAVEIHQVNGQSSDISFDLYLFGMVDTQLARLEVQRAGTALQVFWPVSAADGLLQASDSLVPGAWQSLAAPPVIQNGRVQATLDLPTPRRFFRLAKP